MYGTPNDWFGSRGWHVEGAEDGEDWEQLVQAYHKLLVENADPNIPKVIYSKTRKGRGYHIYDNKSHGAAHNRNSELFGKQKKTFQMYIILIFKALEMPPQILGKGKLTRRNQCLKQFFR